MTRHHPNHIPHGWRDDSVPEPDSYGYGDEPRTGWYKAKMVKGGPFVAVWIWYEGEDEPTLECLVDGEWADAYKVWPLWGGVRINKAEYDRLLAKAQCAKQHEPGRPEANPRKRVKLRELPPIW